MLHDALSAAGRAFLTALVASLAILLPGLLNAPNLDSARAIAVAALASGIVGAAAAVQVYVPRLSFCSLVGDAYGVVIDAGVRAFAAFALVFIIDNLGSLADAPSPANAKAFGIALLLGAATAALRAIRGLSFMGEEPEPARGVG